MQKEIESFPDYTISDKGEVYSKKSKKILKQHKDEKGFYRVQLCYNGYVQSFKVHRLVAEAFIPNPEGLAIVHHINHKKSDNRVANLQWISRYEKSPKYQGKTNAKLTYEQANQIRHTKDKTAKELAKIYNVAVTTIYGILQNRTYCKQ